MLKKLGLMLVVFFFCFFISCAEKKGANLERKIVCFGDSLTQGGKAGETYPDFLQQMINIPVVNLGVGGETSIDGLARIDGVLNQKAFLVLVEFGVNDFYKKVPVEKTKKAIETIVDKIQATGAIVVIITAVSVNDDMIPSICEILKQVSEEKHTQIINGMLNDIWSQRDLFADGLHPNSKGYEKVAEKVYKFILPIINPAN